MQGNQGAVRKAARASMLVGFLMVGLAAPLMVVLGLTSTASAKPKNPIVHRVSAGGPDACRAYGAEHPGCDANYSLVAFQYADGTAKGQYIDRWANGNGFHAVVDCLDVGGNRAWIGGTITGGHFTMIDDMGEEVLVDMTGLGFVTSVQDNGASANDPADQISFSMIQMEDCDPSMMACGPCTDRHPMLMLFDAPDGNVVVD